MDLILESINVREGKVKKAVWVYILTVALGVFVFAGCARQEKGALVETVEVARGEGLVYLPASNAAASSFDTTPDWAPKPDPMAPVDGDMLTRWSSDYAPGEQWIWFELEKDSVVSDVIVRWERAYATEYKILASNDAGSWREVYHEKNGTGGAMEAAFTPVKCRYLKVLTLARINKDWGVSIWEVEMYGPAGHNPHSTVPREAYLGKGEEEARKKEADELINKLAEPVVPVAEKEFQNGVVYTSWMADELSLPASDFTLADIKRTGFDTVAIMVPAYQEDLDSEVIYTNDRPGGDTPTMEALKHAIETCHRLGLRVQLKPHVDPRTDEARINIMPSEKWFDSYEEFILRYARFAQENDVELFSVGTELEATTFEAWAPRWGRVIDKVREVYKGVLTYSANWTEYKEVPFWDRMDFIGIDAYFPLTNSNDPSTEELAGAWKTKADEIEEWLAEKGLTGKGVILTEIGYPSADGANRQPWAAISDIEDQQEQADCLRATLEVLGARPWFKGYYIWQYFPQERWSPLGFTVKGKKAEEVIKEWLKKKEQ